MPRLPISVLVPTRNAAPLLPEHLAAMRAWTDAVAEIVVVDSHSTDGTIDLIQDGLRHPRLKILQHPPGLYQSWNFGIGQLQSEWCYISTVGETITPEGLAHLAEVARELRCDAVISKPRFVDVEGRPMEDPGWPIEDIVRSLRVTEPRLLDGVPLFFLTLVHYRNAILGSSASNLYRTRCLSERPFPTGYGTAGDGGWCLEHCLDIQIGVTPKVFSTFREHPKAYARSDYAVDQLSGKMLRRIEQTFVERAARDGVFAELAVQLRVREVLDLLERQLACQEKLERARAGKVPWSLKPGAWAARAERNRLAARVAELKQAGLARLFPG